MRLWLLLAVCLMPRLAQAACSTPTGVEGQILYNQDYKLVQYCDGTNWVKLGGSTTDSRIGTLTANKWCAANAGGTGFDCTQNAPTASVSGTTNYVSKFTASNTLGNSQIFDNGTNVGIGTATPTGGKLHVAGQIYGDNGGGAGVSLKLEHTGSNFIVRPVSSGSTSTIIENTGLGSLVINPSGGDVGIGTTSPGSRLVVTSASAADTKIEVNANGDQYAGIRIKNNQQSYIWQVTPTSDTPAGRLRLYTSTAGESLTVLPSGNVGIGTTTPSYKLDVAGGAIRVANPTAGNTNWAEIDLFSGRTTTDEKVWNIANDAGSGSLEFRAMNDARTATISQPLTILRNGNVGIGTTTPVSTFRTTISHLTASSMNGLLISSDANGAIGLRLSSAGTNFLDFENTAAPSGQKFFRIGNAGGALSVETVTDNYLSATRLITIQANGNVGIGTTAPTYPLDVFSSTQSAIRGRTTANGVAAIYSTASSASSYGALIENSSSSYYCYIGYLNTYSIVCSGPSSIPSDKRLKKDITNLSKAQGLDALMMLRPISYHWKDTKKGDRLEYGFVAQEVQQVMPNLVGQVVPTSDAEKAEAGGGDLLTMQYDGLISPLVKAVQELKADNDNQAAEIRELRDEIKALKASMH